MKKYFRQVIGFTLLFVIFIVGNSSKAIDLELKEYSKEYQEWLQLTDEKKEDKISPNKYTIDIMKQTRPKQYFLASARLLGQSNNSKFDLRDSISIKLKNQQKTSECWAFAMTTSLETNVALNKNKIVEYSPRHMDYATSRTFLDGINQQGHSREVGSGDIIQKGGGNVYIALGYITSGRGPILEEDMPFVNSEEKINLSEIQNKSAKLKINEAVNFPNIFKQKQNGIIKYTNGAEEEYTEADIASYRNAIKEHIKKYGGVVAVTFTAGQQYFSNTSDYVQSKAYNCDNAQEKPDHQVTIIGWDDNYAITNFNEEHRPQKPGAYIVQNSYGKETKDNKENTIPVFDNGYIYISYEDVLIEQQIVGVGEISDIDYDNLYQHNPLGANEMLEVKQETIYLANRFSKGEKTEYLKEVSLEASAGDEYEVYINPQDGTLDSNKFQKIMTTGKITKDGYHTIKLPNAIKLTGNEFVVCLQKNKSNNSLAFWVEAKETILPKQFGTATSNFGESFFSPDMKNWQDMKEIKNITGYSDINLTIKAFTVNNVSGEEITPEIKITSSKYEIDEENKTCRIPPNSTAANFKTNINAGVVKNIVNSKGNTIIETSILGTGAVINLTDNTIYTLIVTGDVNGDGKITSTDIVKIKRKIVGLEELGTAFEKAGDIDSSNKITATDLLKIKKFSVGLEVF